MPLVVSSPIWQVLEALDEDEDDESGLSAYAALVQASRT